MTVPVSVQVPSLGALFSHNQDQTPALKSTEASTSEPASRGAGVRLIGDRSFRGPHVVEQPQPAQVTFRDRSSEGMASREAHSRSSMELRVSRTERGLAPSTMPISPWACASHTQSKQSTGQNWPGRLRCRDLQSYETLRRHSTQ